MKEANKYNLIESALALGLSFVINLSILVVSAAEFHGQPSADSAGLNNASHLLRRFMGGNGYVSWNLIQSDAIYTESS